MTNVEMLQSTIDDINALVLQGIVNWKRAFDAIGKLQAVINSLKKEDEAREKAFRASIEEAKRNREKMKQEAAERGEELIGGETIVINSNGEEEVFS